MASERTGRMPAQPAMLSTLVASRPPREGRAGILASFTSIVLHAGIVALLFWATMSVGQADEPNEIVIDLFAEPQPEPLPPPAEPPRVDAAPPVDAPAEPVARGSIAITAPTVILPDIPPPAIGSTFDARDYSGLGPEGRADGTADSVVTADDIGAGPVFTPMTVRPTIRNRDDVARALQRFYPALLRDAGIGGTVVVWIMIDETGSVLRTQVQRSSGHPGLDDAALRVGEVIEFTPAMNRDRAVPVWIQWPITFQAGR